MYVVDGKTSILPSTRLHNFVSRTMDRLSDIGRSWEELRIYQVVELVVMRHGRSRNSFLRSRKERRLTVTSNDSKVVDREQEDRKLRSFDALGYVASPVHGGKSCKRCG